MSASVAELFEQHPFDPNERRWWSDKSLEEAISSADELHLQEDSFTYLENVVAEDKSKAKDICDVLLELPPEAIIDNYGYKAAVWVILKDFHDDADKFKAVLQEKYGFDYDQLDAAQGWEWRQTMAGNATSVFAHFTLMQAMKNGLPESVDVPKLVTESALDGVKISAKRADDYALVPVIPDEYGHYTDGGYIREWAPKDATEDKAYYIWLDTPSGFVLTYKSVPNAVGGYALNSSNQLDLHQIQGVTGKYVDHSKEKYEAGRLHGKVAARGLAPLDWRKLIVKINEEIAQAQDIPQTGILAAENNPWTRKIWPKTGEVHLPIDQAKKNYDETATRLGYVPDGTHRNNWVKP